MDGAALVCTRRAPEAEMDVHGMCGCVKCVYTMYTHSCMHVSTYSHPYFPALANEGLEVDTPLAMSTLSTRILVSKQHCPHKNQGPLEKWPTPGLEQGESRMVLRHLTVSEDKEVRREQWGPAKRTQEPASWGPPSR